MGRLPWRVFQNTVFQLNIQESHSSQLLHVEARPRLPLLTLTHVHLLVNDCLVPSLQHGYDSTTSTVETSQTVQYTWSAVHHLCWSAVHHLCWSAVHHLCWSAVHHLSWSAVHHLSWSAVHHLSWSAVHHLCLLPNNR